MARRPSLLPGWSVGHVLTHLARNGDSVVWRLEGAALGELRDQYPGGLEQRREDIDAGADAAGGRAGGRRRPQLRRGGAGHGRAARGGLGRAVAHLARRGRGLARLRVLALARGGGAPRRPRSAAGAPGRRRWCEEWLARELPRLGERTDPARLLAWVIGRGEAPELSRLVTLAQPEMKALPARSTATQ